MKYPFYMFVLPVALVVIFLFYVWFSRDQKLEPSNDKETAQQLLEQWETKTDEQLPVTIAVTPIELGKDAKTWKFDVAFTTHSGSLDDDPVKIASLIDNKGNTYQPKMWEGPGPGGHHREGVLIFDAMNPTPEYITLKIKNVGGITERLFKWDIK
ncbi:MAG TPA: hypothetical protein VJB56_03205 [Candidatus Paceibacterota bacterium]